MTKNGRFGIVLIVGLLCGFLAAAAGAGTVPEGKLIPLVAGGPQQGSLQTQYLTIPYSYTFDKQQNELSVSGKLKFADSLTMNYPGLQQFYLEVLLLDGNGSVLDRKNVSFQTSFNWGITESAAYSSFTAKMSPPPNTAAMAFYFNGRTQSGPNAGVGISFWYDPMSGISW